MAGAEIGGHIGQVVHVGDVDPRLGHGHHHIGIAETQFTGDRDAGGAGLARLMNEVEAGDAQVDSAADKLAGDLRSREEAHGDIGPAVHRAEIGARPAGAGDAHALCGEPVARQLFQAPLGGHGQGNAAHLGHSASRRSTQSAQPEAAMGAVAPSRSRRRSYCPPEASTVPPCPRISKTMPV